MATANIHNNTIAYESQGTGSPVLLIHGFPLNRQMWQAQADALAKSHRVITADLRGFGESPMGTGEVSMQRYAGDLVALLDHLKIDEPVSVAGFSMGGYVTFPFWKHHANRVRSILLVDTRAKADSSEQAVGRRETAEKVQSEGSGFLIEAMMPKLVASDTLQNRPRLVAELRAMMESSSIAGIAEALHAMANRADSQNMLTQIDVPVLIIVGEADAIAPPNEAEEIAKALPHGEYCLVPNAGHMAPMENPDAVSAAMQEHLSTLSL